MKTNFDSISWDVKNETNEEFKSYIKWYKKECLRRHFNNIKRGKIFKGIKGLIIASIASRKYVSHLKNIRKNG